MSEEINSVMIMSKHMNLQDPRWISARKMELDNLRKFGIFKEVDIGTEEPGTAIAKCRWLHVLKNYPHENFSKGDEHALEGAKFRARCIVQNSDDSIVDIESYSPTPSISSVKMLFTLALHEKWEVGFGDVSTAFLREKTLTETYVTPSPPIHL